MAAKKTVDRVAGEMIEMATLFSKRGIVSMKNLEKIKALGPHRLLTLLNKWLQFVRKKQK